MSAGGREEGRVNHDKRKTVGWRLWVSEGEREGVENSRIGRRITECRRGGVRVHQEKGIKRGCRERLGKGKRDRRKNKCGENSRRGIETM